MDEPLQITPAADGSLRVVLRGAIVFGNVDPLRAKLREAMARHSPTAVLVDLRSVTFLDSSGISLLVMTRRLATESGGACLVEHASPEVLAHLRLVGLTQLFGLRAAERRRPVRKDKEDPGHHASDQVGG